MYEEDKVLEEEKNTFPKEIQVNTDLQWRQINKTVQGLKVEATRWSWFFFVVVILSVCLHGGLQISFTHKHWCINAQENTDKLNPRAHQKEHIFHYD